MSLNKSAGAALWAIRNSKKIPQADLGDALSQKQVYLVEQGESSLTIGKLGDLCEALGIHPTTLIVLSEAAREDVSAREILDKALVEIESFEAKGGMALLRDFLAGDTDRAKQQESRDKLAAVQNRKAAGMSQARIAEELGMAKSSVRYFWNKTLPK